ncbi:MAG TPA: T9SS type A sorting domain-containing protein [Bacteroidia bacterium]|nr:T9SS type A sorting domain-containing protein [Bacteroidia bacterium]
MQPFKHIKANRLFCLIILVTIGMRSPLLAQPVSFHTQYGTASQREYAVQMIQCRDSGFLALAWRGGFGYEALALRIGNTGNIIWQRSLKDTSSQGLYPSRCIETQDGGFCILASPRYGSLPTLTFSALIKIDNTGGLAWTTVVDDSLDYALVGKDLAEAADGSIYVFGNRIPPCPGPCPEYVYLMKFNSAGQCLWYESSQQTGYQASRILLRSDSLPALGFSDQQRSFITNTNSSGMPLGTHSYTASSGTSTALSDFIMGPDGKIRCIQFSDISGGAILSAFDSLETLTNSRRVTKANRTISGIQVLMTDTGYVSLLKINDTAYSLITDWSDGMNYPNGFFVSALDPFYPFSSTRKSDGSIFIYGSLYSPSASFPDVHFVKTDIATTAQMPLSGCSLDSTSLNISAVTMLDSITSVNFVPTAFVLKGNYVTDSVANLVETSDCFATGINALAMDKDFVLVYPNPASSSITFQMPNASGTIVILDQLGREVKRQQLNGEKQVAISVADLADGIYFYRITDSKSSSEQGKFVVQHQ